jgi:hypothetical protein
MDFSPKPLYLLTRYRLRFRNPVNALGLGRFESFSLNQQHQTTNLGVGRSNRSGRAIYHIETQSVSRSARISPRLKFPFSLGFNLGKFPKHLPAALSPKCLRQLAVDLSVSAASGLGF